MKKFIASLFMAVAFMVAAAQTSNIEFKSTVHDFGNVKASDGPVSCEFEFTNTSDTPLVILSAKASCGCTRPKIPREPIAPGKTGKIKVTYVPKKTDSGEFRKDVTLKTSDSKNRRVKLVVKGVVIPAYK